MLKGKLLDCLQVFTDVIKLVLLKVEAESDLPTVVELGVARVLTPGCVLLEKAVLGNSLRSVMHARVASSK